MDALIQKIETIQNKQKSLQWGHYNMNDSEIMFAVGNKAYPKEPHYFIVSSNYSLCLLDNSHKKYIYKEYTDSPSVINGVIGLLKEWFPAKQL